MSGISDIKIDCAFRLTKLSALITERVRGQMITENLRLETIDLMGDQEWLYARIKVSGRHNGAITSRFKLTTSEEISDFVVENLNIRISEGGGLLAKGANFVIKHILGDKIEIKVQKKIHDILQQQIAEMTSRYAVMDLGEGLKLRSTLDRYNFEDIRWNDTELVIQLSTVGTFHLELK